MHLPLAGGEQRTPCLRRLRGADDDDAVAGLDLVVAAGQQHPVAADDRRDLRVGRSPGVAERLADEIGRRALLDVELDDLHLALREDVRLPGGGHTDDPADRMRGLELGADDEVDVELAGAPQLDVLGVRRPYDGGRLLRLRSGEHAGDEVHLVPRGARDHEVRARDARVHEILTARAVALERRDVVALDECGEARGLFVEDRDLVVGVQRIDDREANLARPDHEDPHEREAYSGASQTFARPVPLWRARPDDPRARGHAGGRCRLPGR